mgnify:CR=1 FL=1
MVVQLARRHDVDGVTVNESAFGHLPLQLQSPDPGHWCYWTRAAHVAGLDPGHAREFDHADARIAALLKHSTSAHIFPGDDRIVAWYGIEVDGELVAVAGRLREASGAAHLVSVCTHPDLRGRGLAEQVCSAAMLDGIAEGAPMLVLEMYVANDAGRALYSRLGYTEQGRYLSGLLTGER